MRKHKITKPDITLHRALTGNVSALLFIYPILKTDECISILPAGLLGGFMKEKAA